MRLRIGLGVGFVAGYVLGSRAGRERYEQIESWWRSVTGNPQVHHTVEQAVETAREGAHKAVEAASAIREKIGGSEEGERGDVQAGFGDSGGDGAR